MVTWLFAGKTRMDLFVFLVGFPLVNLLSFVIYHYVERPLQSWKLPSLVRHGSTPQASPGVITAPGLLHAAHSAAAPLFAPPASGKVVANGKSHQDRIDV